LGDDYNRAKAPGDGDLNNMTKQTPEQRREKPLRPLRQAPGLPAVNPKDTNMDERKESGKTASLGLPILIDTLCASMSAPAQLN
jgi:hypothetical protein